MVSVTMKQFTFQMARIAHAIKRRQTTSAANENDFVHFLSVSGNYQSHDDGYDDDRRRENVKWTISKTNVMEPQNETELNENVKNFYGQPLTGLEIWSTNEFFAFERTKDQKRRTATRERASVWMRARRSYCIWDFGFFSFSSSSSCVIHHKNTLHKLLNRKIVGWKTMSLKFTCASSFDTFHFGRHHCQIFFFSSLRTLCAFFSNTFFCHLSFGLSFLFARKWYFQFHFEWAIDIGREWAHTILVSFTIFLHCEILFCWFAFASFASVCQFSCLSRILGFFLWLVTVLFLWWNVFVTLCGHLISAVPFDRVAMSIHFDEEEKRRPRN